MSFWSKLFGKNKKTPVQETPHIPAEPTPTPDPVPPAPAPVNEIVQQAAENLQQKAAAKEPTAPISLNELLPIFATYFAPNMKFFSTPGSPTCNAYFHAVNTAKEEIIRNQKLFTAATKWTPQQFADLLNNPQAGITNMMICGLIFKMGEFAVIKDAVYCVDFSESIPNCVALYLLLIAQKLPADQRKMILDIGDGTNKQPLTKALSDLQILDPQWKCTIF